MISLIPYGFLTAVAETMSDLAWCEECGSCHTKEFGDEFHGRLLNMPTVYALAFADIPLPPEEDCE